VNFLLSDGRLLAASRWNNSLHYVERAGIHDCEICGIPHVEHHRGTAYRAVVLASEPISHEAWQEVPDQSLVAVDRELRLRIHSIRSAAAGGEAT
jgi:glutamine amidotransferase